MDTKSENEIQNEIGINARLRPMVQNRSANTMMMKESMQEERELEERSVVKASPGYGQGRPQSVPES